MKGKPILRIAAFDPRDIPGSTDDDLDDDI